MTAGVDTGRTPLLRNPWLWAFLIGAVTITAIRPLLRRIPEPPPVLGTLPPWSLVDQDGRSFGSTELRGKVWIASFFFTRCTSICPAVMHAVSRLDAALRERGVDGIALVSFTVDPEHDAPLILREYAREIGADPARWTLATGDPAAVRSLVVEGFKVPVGEGTTEAGVFDIAHTAKLVLVDGEGRIRGYYDTDDLGLDETLHRSLRVLEEARP